MCMPIVANLVAIYYSARINVTGFRKRCIVHTSVIEYLEIYKNYNEWHTELKVLGNIED